MPMSILTRLKSENDLYKRRILLVGYICSSLAAEDARAILVGGNAVEFYTFNNYTTHDIDLVTASREKVGEILESIGFRKAQGSRHWYHEDLDMSLEVPDDTLAGDLERITAVQIEEFEAEIIGMEDLLIDRLNAYVHWGSLSDFEQAAMIFSLHRDQLDVGYLEAEAGKQGLLDALESLKEFSDSVKDQ